VNFLKRLFRGRKNNAETHYRQGRAYVKQKRWDDAVREFQAALRIDPDNASAHFALGVVYGKQGNSDEAIREFQAVLRVNPNLPQAHLNLGLAYDQQGRSGEAIRELQVAAQLGSQQARALLDDWSSRFDGITQDTRSPRVWHDPNDVFAMANQFVSKGIQLAQAAQAADEEAAKSQTATYNRSTGARMGGHKCAL